MSVFICYTGCTSKTQIAEKFAKDTLLQTQVKRFLNYVDYTNDALQDIYLIILEHNNEEKLIQMCQKNEFNFWLFAVLKNQKNNKTSKLNKNYLIKGDYQIEESLEETENLAIYSQEDIWNTHIQNIIKDQVEKVRKKNWYTAKIWDEYIIYNEECDQKKEKFTYEKFGKKLKIDKDSLFAQVKKMKQTLKNKLNNEYRSI